MEKELIWVDKDLAKQYQELDSDTKKAELVNELIKQKKIDITDDIQNLDDDLLRFRAFVLNYSTEFKKAYDEQANRIYEIWEECVEPIEKIDKKTLAIKKDIYSISNDVEELADKLKNLNIYKIERLIELIEMYNRMSENDKEIFKLILDRDKEK